MALFWSVGARIRKCMFVSQELLKFVLMWIAICASLPSTTHAETPAQTGFLSLDCGYTGASYNDSLGLTWVADDETFIATGQTANQSSVSSDSGISGQVSQSYRYFPEPRSKYCYNLTTPLSVRYLIRANFYLNGSVYNQRRPFQFSMFLNANNWFIITSGEHSPSEFHVTKEAIFYAQGNTTFFCLLPILGVPFISSLELRPLEANMYSYYTQDFQYLVLLTRTNLGANETPSIRFPDDQFDRIWQTPNTSIADLFPIIAAPTAPDNVSRAEVNYVPTKVMQDGWLMDDKFASSFGLSSEFASSSDQVYMLPAQYAFVILYTEYLNMSDSNTYHANAYLDYSDGPYRIDVNHTASMLASPYLVLSSNSVTVEFGALNLDMGPTLNAIEVYGQVNFNFSQTDSGDVDAIQSLKTGLSLTDWHGDPCIPVPHDWLSCTQGSYFLKSVYSVTALNISTLGKVDLVLFTKSLANNSVFLVSLLEMRLTHCGIDTPTFKQLIANFLSDLHEVTTLDLSNNIISSVPEASEWRHVQWGFPVEALTSLNLSRNVLNGTMSSFERVPFASALQEFYNYMSSLPTTWIKTPNNLVLLDLSHNQLEGDIQHLDGFIGVNTVSLRTLNLSYNKLTGFLNSSLYFSSLLNISIANFDQNSIQGTLDLSAWYNKLQVWASNNLSIEVDAIPLFSFLNNSITGISPSAETFEPVLTVLTKNQTFSQKGILLGGNPYCNGAKSYSQRYFCRYSVDEYVSGDGHSNKNYSLIIGVSSGVGAFIFILSLAILATLWKLWKQLYELREIQQALANRKVQPPFYEYNELKLATRDFHNDNKLGHGGFGVVYKGVLRDNTTLAVKKLFHSQRLQELDEFLNEVVLITCIKHKNLVELKGCCIKDKQRMLIYEYAEKGNLAESLWGSRVYGGLTWETRFNICVGIARGLSYLHEELQLSIIHRDIKPENVLLDTNFRPKIADFGLARQFEEANQARYTQVAGTLGYFSPEYASEGQLSSKADVYSYGIVVLEVVTGRKCIDGSLPLERKFLKDWVCRMHKNGLALDILQPELQGYCDEAQVLRAINVALLCVQHDPQRRPSMSTVVTMLMGSSDVDIVLDESDNVHSDVQTLMLSIKAELENATLESPTLNSIVEEDDSDDFHLLDFRSESSCSTPSRNPSGSRKSPRSLIELSSIQGR